MLCLLKSYSANWSTCLFLFFLPHSLFPLSKGRHHWMVFYPWGSALHKQKELVESTLYWALSSFNFCVIIAFTNIIRNPLLAIMDLYSIAGSHLSHQVTLPGLLDILDNIISPANAITTFVQHTLWMISKHTHAIFRQDAQTCSSTVIKAMCKHTITQLCTQSTQHSIFVRITNNWQK